MMQVLHEQYGRIAQQVRDDPRKNILQLQKYVACICLELNFHVFSGDWFAFFWRRQQIIGRRGSFGA